MRKLDYGDLLSGDSIYIKDVGHFHSPKLRDVCFPTKGIGKFTYNLLLSIITWGKEELLNFLSFTSPNKANIMQTHDELTTFDIITLAEPSRDLLLRSLQFFCDENVVWKERTRKFVITEKESNKPVGEITRDNYETVFEVVRELNYIFGAGQPKKFSSERAKQLWLRAEKYRAKQKKTEDKRLAIANMISKICASNMGYTLLNIYDLTVFQLYDQFFQMRYLHSVHLSERIFSIYGSKDKYDIEGWLNPIID